MTLPTAHMLELLERAIARTEQLVTDVDPSRWEASSPCPEMTPHGLVEHLVGGLTQFADVGAGQSIETATFECTFPADEAARQYDLAGDRMMSVWSESGVIERTYPMPWGDTPGVQLVGFMLIEQVTHGWDLATATGQSPGYDDDLAEAALSLSREFDDPSIRVPGMFGPAVEVDDDAPAVDRLAAFLGRRPDDR